MVLQYLNLQNHRLAYQRLKGSRHKPGILFLGGLASDMTGTKASYLAHQCKKLGFSFLRFDYQGHGRSSGEFCQGTVGAWLEDSIRMIDKLTIGPQIVVGSSLGGWIAFLLAQHRPSRIKAIVGIAAAPDFTVELVYKKLTKKDKIKLRNEGKITDRKLRSQDQIPIYQKLIVESRAHLIMRGPIVTRCPVHLLQGTNDSDVPWSYALNLFGNISNTDSRLTLIRGGDHRLTRAQDLKRLWTAVTEFASSP